MVSALQLTRKLGASRIAGTTRKPRRMALLESAGASEVFLDDGDVAGKIEAGGRGGFDKILELVGTTMLRDSLRCARAGGTVCMTGIQGGRWDFGQFTPMADLPNRVRLCAYGGRPADFHAMPWEELVKDVEEARIKMQIRVFHLEEFQEVHEILEAGGGECKLAVSVAQ